METDELACQAMTSGSTSCLSRDPLAEVTEGEEEESCHHHALAQKCCTQQSRRSTDTPRQARVRCTMGTSSNI